MLANLVTRLMKSAIILQHDSWSDYLNDHLVLGVNEFSYLALLVYAASGIIYDMLIVFCSRKCCSDLLCPKLSFISISKKISQSLRKDRLPAKSPNTIKLWHKKYSTPN